MMTYFVVLQLTLTYILDQNNFNDYLCKTFIKRKNSIWIDIGVSRVAFTYKKKFFKTFLKIQVEQRFINFWCTFLAMN